MDDLELALAARNSELRSLAALERRWRRPSPVVGNLAVGRALFKTRGAIQKLRKPDGSWETRDEGMLNMLWQSRSSLWTSHAALPTTANQILAKYFEDRPRPSFTASPQPHESHLLGLVLAPAGSAPGPDGIPYEALQQASRLTAWILGQAWHAAEALPSALSVVLGDSIDLLVWIPKKDCPTTTSQCRPLQLPTCLRRLFGASVAGVLGPCLEPCLTDDQSATRGGHCGTNIMKAYNHLAGAPPPDTNPRADVWNILLGPAALPLL
jgi:hypothetical protein